MIYEREQIAKLKERLLKVSDRINDRIKIISTSQETSNMFWNKMRIDLARDYEELRLIYGTWTDLNLPRFYVQDLQKTIRGIKGKVFRPPNPENFNSFVKKDIHKRTISNLVNDCKTTYFIGLDSGEKTLNRLLRSTQQINIQEKAVNDAITKGFLEGTPGIRNPDELVGQGSLFGAQRRLRNELLKDALDQKYITVIDKNGRTMKWKPDTYAEMVARTKLREANSSAVLNTTVGVGGDLIQVSSHNTKTAYDAQFEGKVYSISGKDQDFPKAEDLPPFHPNCLHNITPFFKETFSDKEIEKFSDFAKGKTEIPPFKKSFVPLKDRELVA